MQFFFAIIEWYYLHETSYVIVSDEITFHGSIACKTVHMQHSVIPVNAMIDLFMQFFK